MVRFQTFRRFSLGQTSCLLAVLLTFTVSNSVRAQTELDTLPPAPPVAPVETPFPEVTPSPTETPLATPTPQPTVVPTATPTPRRQSPIANAPSIESLQAAAHRLNLPLPLPRTHIVIWKSQRRLELWSGPTLVKSYRVALGARPVGGKASRGDGRTPEGNFYICTRNDRTTGFHRFMGLSYPALPDAQHGLAAHKINWREYQIISRRLASRSAPAWDTSLGGWVGIHGGSDGRFANSVKWKRGSPDWTAGCIGLTNRESEEVFFATKLGTPVQIKP